MHNGKVYLDCMPRQEAEALWRKALSSAGYFARLPAEEIAVEQALGRVTDCAVYAVQSVPHYNGAAMDGIAVRAEDTFGATERQPKKLRVLPAGGPILPGTCCVVDTGDVLPPGANAVIMVEDVHFAEGYAEIAAAAAPWQHVRIIGEDIVQGEMIVPERHVIGPADIAALLAAGLERIKVTAKPRVAIIPTGTEIVASRQELAPGRILDINSPMLAAAVQVWGAQPVRRKIVNDDRAALAQAVSTSLDDCDMVTTIAGTSAGTEDYTFSVMSELGQVLVHGIAIKPGKPVVLAVCRGKPVVGLPGYPVSAMLTAELFVRPVLLARQGLPMTQPKQVEAKLARQLFSTIGVEEYVRLSLGNVQGRIVAAPLARGAGLISSLTRARGLMAIPAESDGLAAGTAVTVNLCSPKSELERQVLAVGSHDLALDLLGMHLRRHGGHVLSCANVGSMGGIMAIRNNEAHLAGIHLLDEETGEYNLPFVRRLLVGRKCMVVHLARREQGLLVAPGNPKGIRSLADLMNPGIMYINRQRGSGTRMLLDYELRRLGIDAGQIQGYEKEVATHMAVAASIAGGAADAGLGIRAAAQALGLDFIPIASEQYDLILNFADDDERREKIIAVLRSDGYRREVEALGGYDASRAGTVLWVD